MSSLNSFAATENGVIDIVSVKLAIVQEDEDFKNLKIELATNQIVRGEGKSANIDELSLLSIDQAKKLNRLMTRYMPGSAFDGYCFARNYFWLQIMEALEVKAASATLKMTLFYMKPEYRTESSYRWRYHIAPVVCIKSQDEKCKEVRVLDPSLFDSPVTLAEWKSSSKGNAPFVKLRIYNPGVRSPYKSDKIPLKMDKSWSPKDIKILDEYLRKIGYRF